VKVILHKGNKDKAVVILIHGMGVTSEFFTNTHETTILSGTVPLKYFISQKDDTSTGEFFADYKITLWESLRQEGYNIFTWSQRYPLGSMMEAVRELKEIVAIVQKIFPDNPLALVGHSRGGLIARKFMEDSDAPVRALITISTPHKGSSLAKIGTYLSNIANISEKLFPHHTFMVFHKIVKGISKLLNCNGIKELYKESYFLQQLHDVPSDSIDYLSIGGTEPALYSFEPWSHASYFLSFVNTLSSGFFPEEIIQGKGDGLVSEESSQMPWESEHYALPDNHFSVICHNKAIEVITKTLKKLQYQST
jgi:pimeloyl-ACP methyl ester carboxylesterase